MCLGQQEQMLKYLLMFGMIQLEKDLNLRQELILESARKRIDALNEEANRLKMVH